MNETLMKFLATYETYIKNEWLSGVDGNEVVELSVLELVERFRLGRPTIKSKEICELQSFLSNGNRLPTEYCEFLQAFSFLELDLPFLSFPSTATKEPTVELKELCEAFDGQNIAPFAYEEERLGVFCFDYRNQYTIENPNIVLFLYGCDTPESSIIGPLFSSFEMLLRIFITILDSTAGLFFDDTPSDEQVKLMHSLKSMDPDVFGGIGWEVWWKQTLLKGVAVRGL